MKLAVSGSSIVTPICRSAAAMSAVSLLLSAPVRWLVPRARPASSSARLVIDLLPGGVTRPTSGWPGGVISMRSVMSRQFARRPGKVQLLDRHRLGQVARLIDVGAHEHPGVVGEQLHRDQRQDRRHEARYLRDDDGIGDALADVVAALLVGDEDDLAAASRDLLHVAEGFFHEL